MKKLYTFLIAVSLTAASLNAQQVITSAANGNASSPFTWNCTCVPMDGDTIIINHAITLDVDYAYSMGGIEIRSGGSVTGNSAARVFGLTGGYMLIDGMLDVGYFYQGGGLATNNGSVTVGSNMGTDVNGVYQNNSSIVVGDTLWVNTLSTFVNAGTGTVSCSELGTAGTLTNSGSITTGNILNTGSFTHSGTNLQLSSSFYNTGTVLLNTSASIAGDIWNAENFTVSSYVNCMSLLNGDTVFGTATFTNNGTISVSNSMFNSEDINGTGDFCVVDSTLNSGAIAGSVDICDLSGGGWDMNIGTEAGTVTHCANGPCTIGITETINTAIGISPNPSNEIIRLQLPAAEVGVVEVIDITGRVVMRENITGKEMLLNVLQLPEGMYSVVVRGETQNYSGRFVKE